MQREPCIPHRLEARREGFGNLDIAGDKMDAVIWRRFDESVCIAVDGSIQHRTAELVAIRAEIGAATSKTKTQRRTRTGNHRQRVPVARSLMKVARWPPVNR